MDVKFRTFVLAGRQLTSLKSRKLVLAACNETRAGTATSASTVSAKSKVAEQKLRNEQTLKLQSLPPEHGRCDWIGPPDPDSNLRPKKYFIPDDETSVERRYRLMREQTDRWNHQFWASHNKTFSQSKERFTQSELARLGPIMEDGSERRLTPEQMSVFYKAFLQEKYAAHRQYNVEWYKRNLQLLWPAFQVFLIRLFRKKNK